MSSFLVFHGGSGSTKEEIKTAVTSGVVKMNVDTGNSLYSCGLAVILRTQKIRHPMGISYWYPRLRTQQEGLSPVASGQPRRR